MTKPVFKGRPLVEIPKETPQIGYLEGDFGKDFLQEYDGRVKSDYNSNSALNVLEYDGNVVRGSNSFAVVLANQILRQEGLRTATQADLETAMGIGVMNLRGIYEDTALVLRTEDDKDYPRNTSLAKDLGRQLRERNIKFSAKSPIVIPLIGLGLQRAENKYGLTFNLRDDTEVYNAPILRENGNFNSENIDEKTGLPNKLKGGNRTLYTRNSGLSRLFLSYNLDLNSNDGDLDYSDEYGRVVLVSAEGASENFDPKLAELESKRQEAHRAYFSKLSQLRDEIDRELRGSQD